MASSLRSAYLLERLLIAIHLILNGSGRRLLWLLIVNFLLGVDKLGVKCSEEVDFARIRLLTKKLGGTWASLEKLVKGMSRSEVLIAAEV